MLQKNVAEEIRERRRTEYKSWKKKVNELVKKSKMRVDEEFGRKLSENFSESKEMFFKEVKRERENYIELHRNSDRTDPGVQTRWSDLNLE